LKCDFEQWSRVDLTTYYLIIYPNKIQEDQAMPTINWAPSPPTTQAVKDRAANGLTRADGRLQNVINKLKPANAAKVIKYLDGLEWGFTKNMTMKQMGAACTTFADTFKKIRETIIHGTYNFTYNATSKYYAETVPGQQAAATPVNRTVDMQITFLYHTSNLVDRAGVMIHETSHSVLSTSDAVYGHDTARSTFGHYLAVNRTADALEYLALDLRRMK
jgi:hypothetical protein